MEFIQIPIEMTWESREKNNESLMKMNHKENPNENIIISF